MCRLHVKAILTQAANHGEIGSGDWKKARPRGNVGAAEYVSRATELETLPEQVRHLDEEDATVATEARLELARETIEAVTT